MSKIEPLCSSITVDILKNNCNKILVAKQGDVNSRKFSVKFCSNNVEYRIPENVRAMYAITKTNKTAIWNDCDKIENDTVFGTFSSESLKNSGVFPMQIELFDVNNDIKLSCMNFLLKVLPSSRNADEQVGKNEYGVLDNLIKKADKAATDTENALVEVNKVLKNEKERIQNEEQRKTAEERRQKDTSTAIENCNTATQNSITQTEKCVEATNRANESADRCDGIVDKTGVVLQEEKDKANGVPSLDINTKIKSEQINTNFSISSEGSHSNIVPNEDLLIILQKINKYFDDLKSSAFAEISNSLNVSTTGTVLDAAMGKKLNDEKFSIENIIKSTTISEEGKLMDGKVVSDKFLSIQQDFNNLPKIYHGETDPDNSLGKNGDIYMKIIKSDA